MQTVQITKSEMDFSALMGADFSLSTTLEYLQLTQGIFGERKQNYIRNKAREAEKTCKVIHAFIVSDLTKGLNEEQKAITLAAIEHHKQLIYDFFMMDSNDQVRIRRLMDKIKREKA